MADCQYCGRSAGWFRSAHRECEERHRAGWQQMVLQSQRAVLDDTARASLMPALRQLARESFVEEGMLREALIEGWESAVTHFLDDGALDEGEERKLVAFADHLGLEQNELDRRGAYSRMVKGGVLRDLLGGKLPTRRSLEGALPFKLQRDERMVWVFPAVEYYEGRKRREFVGRTQGFSIRIMKGVYYRIGGFKGHPVETSETVFVGTGTLAVSDKHLYFSGANKSFRIRHDKIVAIEPRDDGVVVHKDGQASKPQIFVTGDGWFTYNLLMNVGRV